MPVQTPEKPARETIGGMLPAAGWTIQDYKALNQSESRGVAVREVLLRGTFTLRGITHPLELPSPSGDALRAACGRLSRSAQFPVLIAARDDGQHLTGQGVLTLDRTAYGSHYGSGKLFRYLGQHVVNDHIHLHVKIHAGRKG
jgi:hypothetical protein